MSAGSGSSPARMTSMLRPEGRLSCRLRDFQNGLDPPRSFGVVRLNSSPSGLRPGRCKTPGVAPRGTPLATPKTMRSTSTSAAPRRVHSRSSRGRVRPRIIGSGPVMRITRTERAPPAARARQAPLRSAPRAPWGPLSTLQSPPRHVAAPRRHEGHVAARLDHDDASVPHRAATATKPWTETRSSREPAARSPRRERHAPRRALIPPRRPCDGRDPCTAGGHRAHGAARRRRPPRPSALGAPGQARKTRRGQAPHARARCAPIQPSSGRKRQPCAGLFAGRRGEERRHRQAPRSPRLGSRSRTRPGSGQASLARASTTAISFFRTAPASFPRARRALNLPASPRGSQAEAPAPASRDEAPWRRAGRAVQRSPGPQELPRWNAPHDRLSREHADPEDPVIRRVDGLRPLGQGRCAVCGGRRSLGGKRPRR